MGKLTKAGGGKRGGKRGREERGRRKKERGDEWWRETPYSTKFSLVFNFANFPLFAKYLDKNFEVRHTHYSCSDCRSVDGQYLGAKLPNPQGVLSKALLTATDKDHTLLKEERGE